MVLHTVSLQDGYIDISVCLGTGAYSQSHHRGFDKSVAPLGSLNMPFYEDIKTADEINTPAHLVTFTSGVYFLLWSAGAIWDPSTTGLLVGLTS